MISHVAAAVLRSHGQMLLCLRSETRATYPGVWDLPGGHIEAGETPVRALRRELREELDIEVATAHLLTRFERPSVALEVFVVDAWSGSVRNAAPDEHEALRWVSFDDLDDLELADEAYPELLRTAADWVPETP